MRFSDFERLEYAAYNEALEYSGLEYVEGELFAINATPYAVYKVLKEQYGEDINNDPVTSFYYYFQSKVTKNVFIIKYDDYAFDQYIAIDSSGIPSADQEAQQFKRLIEKAANRIDLTKVELEESSTLFQNPFYEYFRQARVLLEKREPYYMGPAEQAPNYLVPAFFLLMASLEGFVNLIYELYLLPELRSDNHVRPQIQRANLDVKIRLAPLYCSCFKVKLIPKDSVELQNLQRHMIGVRNNLIHANLTNSMKLREHIEDGIVFWLPEKQDSGEFGFSNIPDSVHRLTSEHLETAFEVVEKMVEYMLSMMKPRHERELSKVIHQRDIKARLIDNEYVIDEN